MSARTASETNRGRGARAFVGCVLLLLFLTPSALFAGQKDEKELAGARTSRRSKPVLPFTAGEASAGAHPLAPLLKYAREGSEYIASEIRDYSCLLILRERFDGKLGPYEHIRLKVRQEQKEGDHVVVPFGVYLKFLGPAKVKGREVLYVRGEDQNTMTVRRGGRRYPSMTLTLDPTGPLATEGRRYPLTDVGVKNLVDKLIGVMENDIKYDECQVSVFRNAKLNERVCTHIRAIHPVRRPYFTYHRAHVFIDNELSLPVYYASYDWPAKPGGEPVLLEEYAYSELKPNIGLTDVDFQRTNPSYGFLNSSDQTADRRR